MSECLGIYIENKLIKYAKVSKNNKKSDEVKIEAFGIKFYDNLNKAIKQIIEETYSYKTPISINLQNEKYEYFDLFAAIGKKDVKKAVDIEFDVYCTENRLNGKSQETRYIATPSIENPDRIRILHMRSEISEINQLKQGFDQQKLSCITPVATAIPTLVKFNPKENALIVNIEENTIITTVYDQKIYNVTKISEGSGEILKKIDLKVNSYSKAYELCRNTTIYTSELQDYLSENDNYLEDIVPTLYSILGQLQRIINESPVKIEKIYITGTGANVNNIDLYFQEYLGDIKCEILKPYFIQSLSKEYNIKDYIEVNSAVALAMQELGEGVDGVNFKTSPAGVNLPKMNLDKSIDLSNIFKVDFKGTFTNVERHLLRGIISVFLFIIIYTVFSSILVKQIRDKGSQAIARRNQIMSEVQKIDSDTEKINKRKTEFSTMLTQLKTATEKRKKINESKNDIPNFLNKMMFVIPEKVQLTSIKNPKDKEIEIEAQCENYEELGYFSTRLKTDNILKDAVTSKGVKQDGVVKVTIKGELP